MNRFLGKLSRRFYAQPPKYYPPSPRPIPLENLKDQRDIENEIRRKEKEPDPPAVTPIQDSRDSDVNPETGEIGGPRVWGTYIHKIAEGDSQALMGRLKLKGAPPKNLKNVKKLEKAIEKQKEYLKSPINDEEEAPEGWIFVETNDDLNGPIIIFFHNESIISFDEEGNFGLEQLDESPKEWEPTEVRQVLIGKYLIAGVFCIQSAFKRYLSSDQLGFVSALREAVGPTEKWTPELFKDSPGQVAFKSSFGKYLTIIDGQLRADSDDPSYFLVKCQALVKWERQRADKVKTLQSQEEIELEEIRNRQIFKYGKSSAELKAAEKEGRLREALLDQRVKSKHDKYC